MDSTYRALPDVHVIPSHLEIPGVGTIIVNAFVLLAEHPVLIDTGLAVDSEQFIAALEAIIDPSDLRWVWLTHDDSDHTGSLAAVMERAPQAMLATHGLGALPRKHLVLVPPRPGARPPSGRNDRRRRSCLEGDPPARFRQPNVDRHLR